MTAQYLTCMGNMTDKALLMVIDRATRDMAKTVKGSPAFAFLQNEAGIARTVLRNRKVA